MNDIETSILGKSRILLVDGETSVRSAMVAYFKNITRMFTAVKSAEEALSLLDGPLWDIIVCNLKLPGMNGLEFCKKARKLKPGIKLILASHYANPSLKKKAADCGIVEIINTPLTPYRLIPSLINVFSLLKTGNMPIARMAESGIDKPETVSILDLDESMIITAFVRFSNTYQKLVPQTCTWIQLNFKGAQAEIARGGQKINLPVDQIEPGDHLKRLYQFPINLMKLTFVRKQLVKELKKRGFLAFEVKRKPTEKTLFQKIRLGAIRRTEAFIGKVGEHIAVRDTISDILRTLFSSNDEEEINPFDLVGHINRIAENGAAEAISVIAALKKGDQLYTHSIDVGAIYLTAYLRWVEANGIVNNFKNDAEIMLSAVLHDIGKIWLPEGIRESRVAFETFGPEMTLLREHPLDGAKLLSKLNMPDIAINMARYHHVKYDILLTTSYPAVQSYDSVLLETRLLAIVDMFQALVGRRPYKRSWHPSDAMKYIHQLAGIEYDPRVWIAFREALGWHPVGSLVELSDGSQAFVVEKAYNGLHRPSVVVTRNSYDEELTHNTFIDLNTEKDIFIKSGLDPFKIYGDHSINRFLQLQVS
ncbi:response regulator [bacterium]|nr:response regulator [bacterium]